MDCIKITKIINGLSLVLTVLLLLNCTNKKNTNQWGEADINSNISKDSIYKQLDKQKEITKHITDIRKKAQQLKDDTKELLKKASEEIEEILLN